jgi:DNA repair protein RadD
VLRPYQRQLKSDIYAAWSNGARNVLAVAPTGSGKTVLFSDIVAENNSATAAIAHRSELVSQMSLAMARNGIRHRVIGPDSVQRNCRTLHLAELKRNFIEPNSRVAVAGVDTLIRRDANDPWFKEVTLWITDEAHHLTDENKWGDAVNMFPNARGLGVTATPCRADGKGLGRHADGVMDNMVVGPTMRDLIRDGYLTDYRIFAPPSDIDLSQVTISASGDFSPPKLAVAVHKSHITGDVVEHYRRIAMGKLGITFAVDVEAATEIAQAYRNAGVPAEVVSAKTPDLLRVDILRRFRGRELLQLVNVDLFGEGFDLPAIEVVSMARPTQSYGLYVQQFGRALRPMDNKPYAIIIDHVGNVLRHGLPDAARTWTLDRRERRTRNTPDDVVPLRVCAQCLAAYERVYAACPYCGTRPVPASRGTPDAVDGELSEMSPELLARLRGEVASVEIAPHPPFGAAPIVVASVRARHNERLESLAALRDVMALWGGWRVTQGDTDAMQQRRFFLTFGVDVLSAQAYGRADADALAERVRGVLDANNVRGIDGTVSNG